MKFTVIVPSPWRMNLNDFDDRLDFPFEQLHQAENPRTFMLPWGWTLSILWQDRFTTLAPKLQLCTQSNWSQTEQSLQQLACPTVCYLVPSLVASTTIRPVCYASALAISVTIMFLDCPSVRPTLVNTMSQDHLDRNSPNVAQTFPWTPEWTDSILVVSGQRPRSLRPIKYLF